MKPAVQDPFAKGQRIDRYEIGELIGQGGMGAVYRAIDTKLGRTVALKTVVAHRRGERLTEEVRQRFLREALAISKVEHRNVVQVLDFGFADNGTPFMVMELLRGRDLGSILNEDDNPLPVEYVADVLLGVCAALRACHHAGIVHRDLKPGNIFLVTTETGFETKVLDFGVSKAPRAADLTVDGQILGTPQYLSPEQVMGTAGPESDQYALGVVLYVCLTKRLPYQELRDFALLRAIGLGDFEPPSRYRPDLPEGMDDLVLRAMRVDPKERFESVHGFGQALWKFASARGKEQWKNLFHHTPPPLRSARQSTHGIPMIEAIAARSPSGAPPYAPVMGSVAVGPTAPAAGRQPATSDSGDRQLLLSTKVSPPSAEAVDPGILARGTAPTRRGGGVYLALVGAVLLAAAGIAVWTRGRVAGTAAPRPTADEKRVVGGASTVAAPPPVRAEEKAAPAQVLSPREDFAGVDSKPPPQERSRVWRAQKRSPRPRQERAAAATEPSSTPAPVEAPPPKYPAVGLTPETKYPAVR